MKTTKLFCVFLFLLLTGLSFGQVESIRNGVTWYDTSGNRIQAHGASILQHNGTYYLLGQDMSSGFLTIGMNLYSSTDMMNWTFLNKVVDENTNDDLGTQERITVRPNLVYNKKDDKFIIWATYKNKSLTYGAIAVFSSPTVDGKYTFEKTIEPFGYDANDSCMFVDDDETAYYVANNKDNKSLNLYKLTDDYLDVTGTTTILFPGQSKEAPVLFKKEGIYYLLNSYKTGWDPNEGQYSSSMSLTSGWAPLKNFGNRITFDTQPTTFFTVTGTSGTSYFYVGDRWKDPDLRESKILILPIEASNGNFNIKYVPELKIDMTTGDWSAFDDNAYISNANWSVVSVSSEQNTTSLAAENVFDNNLNTIWNTNYSNGTDTYPHELVIDLGAAYPVSGFMCVPRQDRNGNVISDFQLFLSTDGTTWGAPVAAGMMTYWSELYFLQKNARYMKLVGHSDLGGTRFASASELRLMTNDGGYQAGGVNSYYQINQDGFKTGIEIELSVGDDLQFGPQARINGGGQTPFYGSFSWYGPDGFYSNSRAPIINNIEEGQLGEYTVYYLDDNYHVQSQAVNVKSSNLSTNTVSPDIKNVMALYPNPVAGMLNISNAEESTAYTVYSLVGKQLLKGQGKSIDVSALASGYYVARIEGGTFKFVKK